MTSECSAEIIRNPAPHRGINAKARKVLIESSDSAAKIASLTRRSSEEEVRKKMSSMSLNQIRRTDSESSNESMKIKNTSLNNSKDHVNEFDGLDELPKTKKFHKTLGAIGKTRSAGDLFRKKTQIRTFQQLNIMKLPSMDSMGSEKGESLNRMGTNASISALDEDDSDRQNQYEMR